MSMKLIWLVLGVSVIVGCGAKNEGTTVTTVSNQEYVDRVADKFPGYTEAEYLKGKTLYAQHCKRCHGLKQEDNYTESQWRKIVPPMAQKAKIDAATEEAILKYVVARSKAE
jgi:nitrate/TMAO reductase-like tetraheme cytochrome c subunit